MAMTTSSKERCAAALQLLMICLILGMAQARTLGIKLPLPPLPPAPQPPSLTIRGYAHLRIGVPDGTEMTVVPGVNGNGSSVVFGTGTVVDDPFRQSTSGTSDLVGRIKGFGIYDDINATNKYLSLYLTFLINYQGVNGSVQVMGTRVSTDAVRTVAVVGGTGDFALARGTGYQRVISFEPANDGTPALISVNEWNLTLISEPVGPNLAYLAKKLPNLVVATASPLYATNTGYQG